jgi:flavodoxin I
MGILAKDLLKNGATIVGKVDPSEYEFDESEAVVDGMFIGLPIDEDFEPELTDKRVITWVNSIKPAFGL